MVTKGINRATARYDGRNYEFAQRYQQKPCIFLSHATKDKKAVIKIGDYITKAGVDIYLDINDSDLQAAVDQNDHQGVTDSIERGLSNSTHILCVVSEETKNSWWVPYEIGYGKKSSAKVGSLLLEDVKNIPSFLFIGDLLKDIDDLNGYLLSLTGKETRSVNDSYQYEYAQSGSILHPRADNHPLAGDVKRYRAY